MLYCVLVLFVVCELKKFIFIYCVCFDSPIGGFPLMGVLRVSYSSVLGGVFS